MFSVVGDKHMRLGVTACILVPRALPRVSLVLA